MNIMVKLSFLVFLNPFLKVSHDRRNLVSFTHSFYSSSISGCPWRTALSQSPPISSASPHGFGQGTFYSIHSAA